MKVSDGEGDTGISNKVVVTIYGWGGLAWIKEGGGKIWVYGNGGGQDLNAQL